MAAVAMQTANVYFSKNVDIGARPFTFCLANN